ncbi:hypothetical protein HAX54_047037 [Datura stramonium]|uniref:Uncharacterized protein n=1 Tax=Datura stramonium TaxID=4076 RepID=A0ABS8WJS0_DATST|nr:hypothetical protein [Datura stramonium]
MQIKLTDHREPYGTSSPLSSNQINLGTNSSNIAEDWDRGPLPAYQTRSIARQQDANFKSDEGDDSSTNRSSLGGAGFDSYEESGNEATSKPARDSEPLRGDARIQG